MEDVDPLPLPFVLTNHSSIPVWKRGVCNRMTKHPGMSTIPLAERIPATDRYATPAFIFTQTTYAICNNTSAEMMCKPKILFDIAKEQSFQMS